VKLEHAEENATRLRWNELSINVRVLLDGKLRGLYEHPADESAFDALVVDKQQSLLVFARRLTELKLWDSIERIENVYGAGGVGINFTAWPVLETALRRRADFTAKFAKHKDASVGFLERGRTLASLHFLRASIQPGAGNFWSAHFDLYSPLAFPSGMWNHLVHEKLRRKTPDWRRIKYALGYENTADGEFEF
jgi:hypothetical protein